MALDPTIPLSIRPQQQIALPQIQSPIDRYGRLLTLRNLMQQGQLGQMNIEQTRLENEALQDKARRTAAAMSLFAGGQRPPETEVIAKGGKEGIDLYRSLYDTDKSKFDAFEATTKAIARAAQGLKALPADKRDFGYRTARSQLITANPALAAQIPEDYQGDSWLDQQIHQALTAEQELQDARAQAKFDIEKPELAAKSLQGQLAVAAQTVPDNWADWETWRADLSPGLQKRIPAFFSPVAREMVLRMGLTREQQAVGERAAAQAAAPGATQQEFQEIFLPGYLQKKGVTGKPTPQQVTEAYTEFQKIRNPYMPIAGRDFPKPQSVEDQDARLRARADVNGLSVPQFNQIHTLARAFDSSKAVKDFQEINDKYKSVLSILNKPSLGGPGDVAFVFEAMHGIEPGSVVRSDEFARVANSGNIFAGPFARFNGYLKPNGGFLPPGVKQAFMEMLKQKVASHGQGIHKVYQDFGRRIDLITGQPGEGTKYLTDYSGVLGDEPGGGGTGVQGMSTDQLLQFLLKK